MSDDAEVQGGGGSKQRGPNFPSISLARALELAQILYDKEKRAAVAGPVVLGHWGYKNPKSSTATMALAALRSYGLVDYQGAGLNRLVKLSTRALKILLKTPGRDAELREAALAPKVHGQIWDRYKEDGLPSDEAIRHYLILELDFNDSAVGPFLARLRETFSLAKLDSVGTIPVEEGEKKEKSIPRVGDLVQWVSQGVMQFPEPRSVTGLSEDGEYVFVHDSPTGLPVEEVDVVESTTAKKDLPADLNARFEGGSKESKRQPPFAPLAPSSGMRDLTIPLIGGAMAILRTPVPMTEANFALLTTLLNTMKPAIVTEPSKPSEN